MDYREHPYGTYADRRHYEVATDLDDLRGPTTGIVRLPIHLDWSGSPDHDLDAESGLRSMYSQVLSEAMNPEDLELLDAATLKRLWPGLPLPRRVVRLWEERFPELRQVADD